MDNLKKVLQDFQAGKIDIDQATELLSGSSRLEYATLDLDRNRRTGFPEVVYGAGKSPEQLVGIFSRLREHQELVLATRINEEQAEAVLRHWPDVRYEKEARLLIGAQKPFEPVREGYVAIVAAGTSDWPVAQEAAWTVRCFGSEARVIADVGVAGIHRLFQRLDEIRGAAVIVCIAGMEGALASVLAGLVDKPVIAVPTSVGYGANLGGIAALLSMLNSCANGVAVVNIDNGFGAGYLAGMIHRQSV
ncbi:nickel pincer cofactor biosynthesis protein LarB [Brevibacillus composti]|uniref:Nickel pincer cofactor biosynthesis protein LarB n=1 Tax=Brevibacillus composti TaxID=2796470 RepID=A0A7T5EIY4_9BACL|nr:nickel pincer cofactor biosynthesis protein LarB [Brevibacillus composti]QQE73422.1 nickel pincer cofactor biosynthesis protein LarB [Brevibacillus composti]QUO40504.1 nickel pincer cofactor biosynthesis protein LarB [Brevibacillus composti]